MNAQNLYGNPLQWSDWFPGYSKDDLVLLEKFHDPTVMPLLGFVMDFVGGRTRTELLWTKSKIVMEPLWAFRSPLTCLRPSNGLGSSRASPKLALDNVAISLPWNSALAGAHGL